MFGLESLDVLIGLFFVYLTLSLACMALNEWITHLLHLRGRMLREAVTQWIGATAGGAVSGSKVYAHALIQTLFEKRARPLGLGQSKYVEPSYIPSRTLVLAFTDLVRQAAAENTVARGGANADVGAVAGQVDVPPAGGATTAALTMGAMALDQATLNAAGLPASLTALLRVAEADAHRTGESIEDCLEAWVDSSMDRLSADYKRRMRWVSLLVALGITLAVNANTITIVRALSSNASLRGAMVDMATRSVRGESSATDPQLTAPLAADSGSTTALQADTALSSQLKADIERIKHLSMRLNEAGVVGLPIGYPDGSSVSQRVSIAASGFVGLLITAFAVSLGAPFWFDMLKRVVEIRSAGLSPDEADKKRAARK